MVRAAALSGHPEMLGPLFGRPKLRGPLLGCPRLRTVVWIYCAGILEVLRAASLWRKRLVGMSRGHGSTMASPETGPARNRDRWVGTWTWSVSISFSMPCRVRSFYTMSRR